MKKSDYITLRITPQTKEILKKIAEKEDRTVSYIANKILEKYLTTYLSIEENEKSPV